MVSCGFHSEFAPVRRGSDGYKIYQDIISMSMNVALRYLWRINYWGSRAVFCSFFLYFHVRYGGGSSHLFFVLWGGVETREQLF